MRVIIFLATCMLSTASFAGFCDGRWGKQNIESIHTHRNIAYIKISPGLSSGHDSDSATLNNEVALVLNEENRNNIYPLVLMAFAAKKEVTMMYCDGVTTHGYKGGSNIAVKINSLKVSD